MQDQITTQILSKICEDHREYFYLASPYTNPDPEIVEQNFQEVLVYSWLLHQKGIYHFCPIASCHQIAKTYGMPTDYLFWEGYNFSFIRNAKGIIIANIPGWERSKGVSHERRIAADQKKIVYLVTRTKNDPPALLFSRL